MAGAVRLRASVAEGMLREECGGRVPRGECMSRCPATTRRPWLPHALAPAKSSSTDRPASCTGKNSGSERSRPSIRMIQQRVPSDPSTR